MTGEHRLSKYSSTITSFLLLFSCIALGIKDYNLTKKSEALVRAEWGVSGEALSNFLNNSHTTLDGKQFKPRKTSFPFLVIVIFKPSDCVACTEQLSTLNELSEPNGNISVIGIASFHSLSEAREQSQALGIRFPLVLDQNGVIFRQLAPAKTPWAVVVASKTGNVLFETPLGLNSLESKVQIAQIRRMTHSAD